MIDFVTHHAGVIGLLMFVSFFVVAGYAAYRPSKKSALQAYAQIPLQENEND